MAVWDDLKVVLAQLRDEQPGVLTQFPMPEVDEGRKPPFAIGLAPWAEIIGEQLHRQFGDNVDLTVGALPYPAGQQQVRRPPATDESAPLLDPRAMTAELDGPAVVSSGHTLHHRLLLRNHTDHLVSIATNGQVTAVVVDPQRAEAVGGYSGAQIAPLITFRVEPGEATRIPLLIGTESFVPALGYAVPPGDWGLQAPLTLGGDPHGERRRTSILPLTITA
jgi:hypothetical protein